MRTTVWSYREPTILWQFRLSFWLMMREPSVRLRAECIQQRCARQQHTRARAATRTPEAVKLIVAGGAAGKSSAVIGSWAAGPRGSQMVTYPCP